MYVIQNAPIFSQKLSIDFKSFSLKWFGFQIIEVVTQCAGEQKIIFEFIYITMSKLLKSEKLKRWKWYFQGLLVFTLCVCNWS